MKKNSILLLAAVTLAVLFSGCGKVPQAELNAAEAAIDSAKIAGADIYLIEDFTALQDSMKMINENIEVQKGKLFKKYNAVKDQLAYVTTTANQLVANTETRKQEVKEEVLNVQNKVSTLLQQNNELLTKAPKGKEGKAALEAIKNDLSLIESSNTEVSNMVSDGDFLPALDKAYAAKDKAMSINTELNNVIEKYNKANKR
ncbi:MAG TPA: hypothetical protein VKA27_15270 [Sunxiuqinia sp.]|nr:hypothetical protein [Sunxiuqinia sp.]